MLNGQSHDRHVTNGASHDVSVPLHYDNGDDDDGSYEVAGASVRPEDLSHPFDVSFETSTGTLTYTCTLHVYTCT